MTKTIKITTEYIKLDQLLKIAGYVQTGGEAKVFIATSNILVEGVPTWARGKKGYVVNVGDDELHICM